MRDALHQAFRLLLQNADPARRAQALRAAIGILITDTQIPGPPQPHGAPPEIDATSWSALRPRLAEVAGRSPGARRALAQAIGLAETTLSRQLSYRGGTGPGREVRDRAAAWLASRDGGDGANSEEDKAASVSVPARGNGHVGGVSAGRLTDTECERLNFMLAADPAAVRSGARVSPEVAAKASGGAEMAVEIVDRLRQFLAS